MRITGEMKIRTVTQDPICLKAQCRSHGLAKTGTINFARKFVVIILTCAFPLGVASDLGISAASQQVFIPDDLLNLESVGDVTFSPDGEAVAYVRQRPRVSAKVYQQPYLGGNDRGDVWLASIRSNKSINLTRGESDGSGFWMPRWSPDGTRIAMLSTRGNNVGLWVWERATDRLRRLSERGLARPFTSKYPLESRFIWLDAKRLAAVLLPEGERPYIDFGAQDAGARATLAWQKAREGKETTASALDSGVPADLTTRRQQEAVVFTLGATVTTRPVASGVELQELQGSSDGRYLSLLRQVALLRPDQTRMLDAEAEGVGFFFARYRIALGDTAGQIPLTEATGVGFVVPGSFQWAPSGSHFAFFATRPTEEDGPVRLFKGEVGSTVTEIAMPEVYSKSFVWIDGERLLVAASSEIASSRTDWWLVSPGRVPINLTANLRSSPSDLHLVDHFLVGQADGQLLRLDIAANTWTNLGPALNSRISSVLQTSAADEASLLLESRDGTNLNYFRVHVNTGRFARLAKPSTTAKLLAYSAVSDTAVFTAAERIGTTLSVVQRGRSPFAIAELNGFLRNIAEGKVQYFEYRGLDGEKLGGWVILPAQYHAGESVPMVAWVHPGDRYSVQDGPPEALVHLSANQFLNLQLLAARGYAVLLPSIPKGKSANGKPIVSDINLELMNGVLPAIDKVVELRIADPNRVAMIGHSVGGFAVYGLVTQTTRCKAAIALAGFSDLFSFYNSVVAEDRYLPYIDQRPILEGQVTLEGHYLRGGPPWQDFGRYLRNSPITSVDRVQTPLLVIHGDMDHIPIEQAEEFFNALFRQGKRARFVRYWGEGHQLSSPANIRNMWTQIYAWLDEFCDISRDGKGNMVFDGDHVKSRNGAPALKLEDFAKFNEIELKSHPWVNQKSEAEGQKSGVSKQ